jgi:preprotein translocase subunit SecA
VAWSAAAAARALGITAHDGQLLAARIMLGGDLAEMATGEGKTLAGALAAAVAALCGVRSTSSPPTITWSLAMGNGSSPTTPNSDYRWRRWCLAPATPRALRPILATWSMRTARELIFDYLRDHLDQPRRQDLILRAAALAAASPAATRLRGLSMAIVDEADSVLIDEASLPFILSRADTAAEDAAVLCAGADCGAPSRAGHDYRLRRNPARAELTAAGLMRLRESAAQAALPWRQPRLVQHLVELALTALHGLESARDYLVRDGRVQMVDAVSGRTQSDGRGRAACNSCWNSRKGARRPGHGAIAQLTYQQFFPRYLRLAGMSGTLTEARAELRSTYGLAVVRVPLHAHDRRQLLPTRVYASRRRVVGGGG